MKYVVLLTLAALASAITLRPPLGKYGVSSTTMEMVDTSRNDTYASKPEHRRIMVSAFYPATLLKNCQPVLNPYMTRATAIVYDQMYASLGIPNGTFGSFDLSTCAFNRKDRSRGSRKFPVVLFSPGLGNSRLLYGAMAQSLASQGFVVITMDHAYDAAIVEYPDGSVAIAANIDSDAEVTADLGVRQRDVSFLIDQLHDPSVRQELFHDIADPKSLTKILMTGHSLGGATAAATMQVDHRIVAGVNLDGRFFDSVMQKGLGSPFMIMSREGHNLTSDPTWAQAWPKMAGSKLVVSLKGTTHGTFTDLPLLANALGIYGSDVQAIGEVLGIVNGTRADSVINAFSSQFFSFALGASKDLQPVDSSKRFSEAIVLDKQIRKQCN